jgi:hypothetical protein
MGVFDPAYKKMILKSPAAFQDDAMRWGPLLEAQVLLRAVPPVGHDLFRAVVVGQLALRASQDNPGMWSPDGLRYITHATHNAQSLIPRMYLDAAHAAAREILLEIGQRRED